MSRPTRHPQQRITDARLAELRADLAAPNPPSQYELARRYGDEPGAIAADLDAFLAQLSTAGFLDHG